MKIVILGNNSVALLWASAIAMNNKSVSVTLVHDNIDLHKVIETQNGMQMSMDTMEKVIKCPMKSSLDLHEEIKHGCNGFLIMCPVEKTKTYLKNVGDILPTLLDKGLVLCALQHGLGNVEAIQQHVPKGVIMFGTTVTHANIIRDGLIRGTLNRPSNIWSASGVITENMKSLINIFTGAGLPTTATPEAEIMLWKKLAVNCSLNVVSAIAGLKISHAWNEGNHSGRLIMTQIAREVAQIAQLEGIKLTEQESVDALTFVSQKGANHVSNMCNDMLNNRETDVEDLNGFVLRAAKKHNLQVPSTEQMYHLVKLIEATYSKRLKPLVKSEDDTTQQENKKP
mmetsp:Transcript_974/g.1525  ORF Transcript_974/g.1525 Transcript_974/m.1525 type:complete len:340 (-) Transcript_974:22-1041(-)